MNKHILIAIICSIMVFPSLVSAQEKKPKVALVLSGGGAKGVAHIPTLQLLDSLGIVPDLVIGTSMGSIVGGLYSMGYSGNEIEKLTKEMDWDALFGGKVSLLDISNEEKSEYERYLIELDIEKGKPKPSSGVVSDQNLLAYLHSVTYQIYDVSNFNDLSIPFRAVATDIVNGKEVILGNGSLSKAMRASMSIPGVFSPVDYEDVLLVDGGVLNNFPTDIAKNMGADIIIGSDVGGGMKPKKDLDNIATLIFQTGMLSSNLKNPGNRELCTILVDHVNNLTYSTGDFNKATEIYEEGKIATKENNQAFIELAEKLKGYKQLTHSLPIVKDEFLIQNINYAGISKQNLPLAKSRSNFKDQTKYSTNEINDGIDKMIGTNIFDHIHYAVKKDERGALNLNVRGHEKSTHRIKGALHFDNSRQAGILLNYTGRNMLGNSSRILATVDIASQERYRVQYQNIFGKKKDWWVRTEWFLENLDQEYTVGGELAENLKYRYSQFDTQINKNLNSFSSYVGIGLDYENTRLKPNIDSDINDNVIGLDKYKFTSWDIYAQFGLNTMNQVFYPTKGTYFNLKVSHAVHTNVRLSFSDETLDDLSGSFSNYTKLILDFEKRFPLNKKMVGIIGASSGLTIYNEPESGSDDVSYSAFGYGSKYYMGGVIERPRKDNFIFPGLKDAELPVTQFMMIKLSMQYNVVGELFLTPHVHLSSVGFNDFDTYFESAFSPKGNWNETTEASTLFSAGLTTSFKSFLGPIDFDVSYVNDIEKVRIFFGVGLQFNRSK